MTVERSQPFVRSEPRQTLAGALLPAYPGRVEKLSFVLAMAAILLGAAGILRAVLAG